MIACLYLTVGVLVAVLFVCEKLVSAINHDSIQMDRKYLWENYSFTLEDIKYPD